MWQNSVIRTTSRFVVVFALAGLVGTCNVFSESSCFDNGGIDTEITKNHGHKLRIPSKDFTDPTDGTYSIQGNASHDHVVIYIGEQLATVSDFNSETVTSSTYASDNHSHRVTLDCK
ncbi:MAG: hypothetical protein BMS9Abin05_2176 [Rhodothermia bacterium]|nr:MAG: hypothetical protein BMS9Abin05_2176 [Rhodothermia bacterium]